MARSAPLTWSDTKRYLLDLESVLGAGGQGEQADALKTLRDARVELQSIFTAAQLNAKKILTELQHNVSKLEAASTETVTPIEQIRVQTEQLERQRVQLLEQIARLQQERDVSSSSMQRLLSSTLAYKAQLAALEEQQAKHVPQRRHWIQLYQNISAMKFDYSVPAEEALEGFIAPPGDVPARPFRFDTRAVGGVALADSLWSSISQAHAGK